MNSTSSGIIPAIRAIAALALLGIGRFCLNANTKLHLAACACLGRRPESRHVCTDVEPCEPVVMCGQLLEARRCKECGRVITSLGFYTSPEQIADLRNMAESLINYPLPETGEDALKYLHNLAEDARKIMNC